MEITLQRTRTPATSTPANTRQTLVRWRLAQLGFVIVAAVVVFWRIGSKPLWGDEIASVTYAGRSVPGIFHVLHVVDAPLGAYYLMLHFWLHITSSAAGLRALSAIFAIAAAAVQVALVKRWFGVRTALISGVLLLLNPFFLRYAQEGRPYSLVLLLDTVSTWLFVNAVRGGRRRDLVGYAAVSVLAVYGHLFAVLVLVAQAASLLALREARANWRRWLGVFAVIGAAIAPLVIFSAGHQAAAVMYLGGPRISSLWSFAREVAGKETMLIVDAVVLVGGLSAALFLRRRRRSSDKTWLLTLLGCMLVLPPLLLLGLSVATPSFANRYLIGTVMPLTVLLAVVLSRLPRRSIWLGVLVVGLLSARTVRVYENQPYKEQNIPGAVAAIMHASQPGDAIGYAPDVSRRSFAYYWPRYHGRGTRPADIALARPQPADAVFPREIPVPAFFVELPRWPRVWVVGNPDSSRRATPIEDMFQAERSVLPAHFHLTLRRNFGHVTVELYTHN